MDFSTRYPVYLGVWTNWSRGSVMGSTLTLTSDHGNLLIAFVAFFVAWVGTRLWRILCLILHFTYSSSEPRGTLHHQLQVTLRNSASPESGLLTLANLIVAWTWGRGKQPISHHLRLLLLFSVSILIVVGFTLASGFSSQVTIAMGQEVLVSGSHCAVLDAEYLERSSEADITRYYSPYWTKQINNWANYVQLCYTSDGTSSARPECRQFVHSRLPSSITTNASCPFDTTLCKSQDQNLIIDTGYLNSHDHFGINTPPDKRFLYRRRMQCAPLATEGFTSTINRSADRFYKRYHYGPWGLGNHTYEHPDDSLDELAYSVGIGAFPEYSIGSRTTYYGFGQPIPSLSDFDPVPEFGMLAGDADLKLFFLSSNEIGYNNPTNDPWYSATTLAGYMEMPDSLMNGTKVFAGGVYVRDEAASPLACKVQEQLCNPNLPEGSQCTPLASTFDYGNIGIATVFQNQTEMIEMIEWAFNAAFGVAGQIDEIPDGLGSHSLTSTFGLFSGYQGYLPDNQWILEMEYWHNIAMACLQGAFVSAAAGPGLSDPTIRPWFSKLPRTPVELNFCSNQKILSTAYSSFNLFGILFIFVVGAIIILISIVLDPIMVFLRRKYQIREYQQLEWQTHEALQLQRLAHEAVGAGTWSKAADNVPVTLGGETLALLNISDPEHPILHLPIDQSQQKRQEKIGSVTDEAELTRLSDERQQIGTTAGSPVGTNTLANENSHSGSHFSIRSVIINQVDEAEERNSM